MSRVRNKDTDIELDLRRAVHARGLRFRKHVRELPGTPDMVFAGARVVVFVDGDFWHGWRFPEWRHTLSPYWVEKIEGNRRRDRNNFAKLRRRGWRVLRVWGHEVKVDVNQAADRVEDAVRSRMARSTRPACMGNVSR